MKVSLVLLFTVLLFSLSFAQLLNIPRDQTIIVPGPKTANPGDFNVIAGWKDPHRGIQQLLLEPLWMCEPVRGEIINALAESGPIYNKDFTKMTVKLRKGVYWSDGVPFTADDVVFTVTMCMKYPEMARNMEFTEYVDKVYKEDDYTVVFELKKPNPRFHTYFIDRWGYWWPMPKHIFEKVDNPVAFTFNPPVGTGPYKLKDYDPAGYWVLWERREDWQRTPTGMIFGMPKPKYVLFYAYETDEKMTLAFIQNQLDVTGVGPQALKALLKRTNYAKLYSDFPFVPLIDPVVGGITINTGKYPFNMKEVRWALALALDIVKLAEVVEGNMLVYALHVPALPLYRKLYYEPLEKFLRDLTIAGEKVYDPDVPLKLAEVAKKYGWKVPADPKTIMLGVGSGWWKYSPKLAEKLLTSVGFKRDKAGKWLLPDGKPWKIELGTNPNDLIAFAIAQQWREFGIDVDVITTYISGIDLGNFEVLVTGNWPAPEPWGGHADLHRVLYFFHSKYQDRPLGERVGQVSRWFDKRLDKIIDDMEKLDWDDPRNVELGIEGLKILVEEMPTIPLGTIGVLTTAIVYNEYYWTNWPTLENPYMMPYWHWSQFKYLLTFLEPTGRK